MLTRVVRSTSMSRPGTPFSRGRRWWWLLLSCLLILLPHLIGVAVVSTGDMPVGTSIAMLRLTATVVALAAGGLLCIQWWVSGDRSTAWLGAAILSLAITQVPSALLELDSSTAAAIDTPPTVLDSLLAIPFLALLAFGITGRTFTHRITPILLAVSTGLTFGAVRVAYTSFDLETRLHLAELSFTTGMLGAAVLGAVVVGILMRYDLPTWARNECIVAAIAVTYGRVARIDSWGESGIWEIAASAFLLAGFVILASTATELLRQALKENEKRINALAERAESAEETLRVDEETLHELKGAIAGIGSASRILTGMSSGLDAAQQRRLVDLLSVEMDRLERLITGARSGPAEVQLDPLIGGIVSAYRYAGMPIHSFASGASAWTVASDLTDVLHVLLSNAARHAPGATTMIWVRRRHDRVDVHVSDEGPGIPAALRDRVFERGARSDGSPGQGLGLHIARRVIEQHSGRLTLADDPRHGTTFIISLPLKEPAQPVSGEVSERESA